MQSIDNFYEEYWKERLRKEPEESKVTLSRAKVIEKFFESRDLGRVLDVGCGDGTLLSILSDKYNYSGLYGIEISTEAGQTAEKKGINCYIQNVESQFPFESRSFDTIICSEVLEHLVIPENALREVYRVAKSYAKIIFSVPNIGYVKNRIKLLFGKSPFEQGRFSANEHLHFWTKESFRNLLEDNEFKCIKFRGGFGPKVGKLSYYYPSLLSNTLYVITIKHR